MALTYIESLSELSRQRDVDGSQTQLHATNPHEADFSFAPLRDASMRSFIHSSTSLSSFDFSDFGWKPRGDRTQIDLLCNTPQALSDMGYTEIISSTDMDTAAKLKPRGLNLLQQQAPGVGDTVINILKAGAEKTGGAVVGSTVSALIDWIFKGNKSR